MKTYALFLLILFTITTTSGQTGWFWQNPQPQGNDLRAVSFCDRNNGWAVGNMGAVLHTSNGGTTWQNQWAKSTNYLQDVVCLSPTTAIGSGAYGLIIKTTNSGASWDTMSLGSASGLASLKFIDQQNGFAMEQYSSTGNLLFKTTNGGASWQSVLTGFKEFIYSIYFVNANLGYAAGGGIESDCSIYKTTNGGTTWVKEITNSIHAIYSIVASDTIAWAVGYDGDVLKTINQGTQWITVIAGNVLTSNLNGVHFYNYKTTGVEVTVGMAVGDKGMAKRSSDYGSTWTTVMSDWINYKTLYDVQMIDSLYGYAVGAKGKIMKTIDGGKTWFHQNTGFKGELWSVWFADSLKGAVVGDSITNSGGWADGKVYSTTDGGNNWVTNTFPNASFEGVHFPNTGFGCAVGFNGRYAVEARTLDGGPTWRLDTIYNFRGRLWSVFFHNAQNGVAVGDSGMIMHTDNGGASWSRINSGTTNNLFYVTFSYNLLDAPPSDTGYVGYAMGSSGTLLKSFDGGNSWGTAAFPGTAGIYGMSIVPRKAIYIVASNGVYKSTSYNVYNKQISPSSSSLQAVWAATENIAIVAGGYGAVASTTDGGTTWKQIRITSSTLHSTFMLNPSTAWVVGEAGSILKTWSFGITGILPEKLNGEIPENFTLSQNYPNPFNPSTRINYQVPCASKIVIDLYNIKGQRVATLVNLDQSAGSYSFEVNAASLNHIASGVYFYRMNAISKLTGKSYFNTKKMILLK